MQIISNEVKSDLNKVPKKDWKLFILIWTLILFTFFSGIGVKADELTFNLAPPLNKSDWKIFDIDKFAEAVARQETGGCTKGYGKVYNNCFGIKNGNTAPCERIGQNRMCIYDSPEDSYTAFKKIWSTWYGGLPTLEDAKRYSGNHNATQWYTNTRNFYFSS